MPKVKKSFSYWKKRELANQLNQIKDEKVIASKMKDNYTDALNDIEHQINVFYERYAGKQGISIEEATKRVSEHDVKAFEKKAKQYVKDKDFSPKANAELKLYNATMRINRLELLKAELNLRLADVTNENEGIIGEYLEKLGMNEYARQAGILDSEIRFSKEAVKAVVHGDYKYGDFSSNIWTNHEKLINNLGVILRRSMIQGSNPTTMIGRLRKEFDVSHYEAKRLLVTEAARVQGDIQIDAFEQAGYDSYTYIAEPTACDICAKLDGEHFSIEDREVGVNYYPMHPFCKCSSSPYFDRTELDKELEEYRKNKDLVKLKRNDIIKENNIFTSDKGGDIDDFFKKQENYNKWINSLDKKEKNKILEYTMSYHERYNSLLRNGVDSYLNSFGTTYVDNREYYKKIYEAELKELLELSNKISEYTVEKSFKTYRRFPEYVSDIPNKLSLGDVITEKGFLSTSLLKETTADFGGSYKDVLYEIDVKKGQQVGAYISELSDIPEEKEFLIKANSKLKVLGENTIKLDDGTELRVIQLEVEE